MNRARKSQATGLAAVFTPAQVEAISAAISDLRDGQVSRAEHERLEAMVKELLARVPPPAAPAVTPEELVILAAAVTAYLGKPVRVRGARRLPLPLPGSSPWGRQGRVSIQASHALAPRRGV